jgi:transcription initiation factor IIE alpha subunit
MKTIIEKVSTENDSFLNCSNCQEPINVGEEYRHKSEFLCEDCCMTLRTPRHRKPIGNISVRSKEITLYQAKERFRIKGLAKIKNDFGHFDPILPGVGSIWRGAR